VIVADSRKATARKRQSESDSVYIEMESRFTTRFEDGEQSKVSFTDNERDLIGGLLRRLSPTDASTLIDFLHKARVLHRDDAGVLAGFISAPITRAPSDAKAEDKPAEDKPAEDKPAEDKPAKTEDEVKAKSAKVEAKAKAKSAAKAKPAAKTEAKPAAKPAAEPEKKRCSALTQAGTQCTRNAKEGSRFCSTHMK